MKGTIARLVSEKGFGFIAGEAGGPDLFFHRSGLQQSSLRFEELAVGQVCEFTPIEGPKGPRAIEVLVR